MFKITQKTLRGFTLAEVLQMVAMNQLGAKQNAFGNERSQPGGRPYRAEAAQLPSPSADRCEKFYSESAMIINELATAKRKNSISTRSLPCHR